MASRWFPEVPKDRADHVLRNAIGVDASETDSMQALAKLESLGIVACERREYVKCAYPSDPDFVYRRDQSCEGEIQIVPDTGDHYCPECGDPVESTESKRRFERTFVTLRPQGIVAYIQEAIRSLACVEDVCDVGYGAFNVHMAGGASLLAVIADSADFRYRAAGLFFAEPTLYLVVSPINNPVKTVLEEKQHVQLAEVLSGSAESLEDKLRLASVRIPGRVDLAHLENRFDAMLDRHKESAWQFFEVFVSALREHFAKNPEAVQSYLVRLRRLSGTVFGEFSVPIGGSGVADLRAIEKFEYMSQVFGGNSSGDAKCYTYPSALSYSDVVKVNAHLDADPMKPSMAVIYLASDRVVSTAWNFAMSIRRNTGKWKILILPRYLLLEVIMAMEAGSLLDM